LGRLSHFSIFLRAASPIGGSGGYGGISWFGIFYGGDMSVFPETSESAGKKVLTLHPKGDGFLITMRWDWYETGIAQEITFFSPIGQALEIAEEIIDHIGQVIKAPNRIAPEEA
jgi:hypothetical protein